MNVHPNETFDRRSQHDALNESHIRRRRQNDEFDGYVKRGERPNRWSHCLGNRPSRAENGGCMTPIR